MFYPGDLCQWNTGKGQFNCVLHIADLHTLTNIIEFQHCSEALWPWLMVLLLPNIIHSHSKNLFGFPKKHQLEMLVWCFVGCILHNLITWTWCFFSQPLSRRTCGVGRRCGPDSASHDMQSGRLGWSPCSGAFVFFWGGEVTMTSTSTRNHVSPS